MLLTIRDEELKEANISEQELRQELALLLYEKWVWDTKTARRFCGMERLDFLNLAGSRNIPVHYAEEQLLQDWETIKSLGNVGSK